MSLSLSAVACRAILQTKTPGARPSWAGSGCIRNPRAAERSGCTPAEPYPLRHTIKMPLTTNFRNLPVDKPHTCNPWSILFPRPLARLEAACFADQWPVDPAMQIQHAACQTAGDHSPGLGISHGLVRFIRDSPCSQRPWLRPRRVSCPPSSRGELWCWRSWSCRNALTPKSPTRCGWGPSALRP
jgi:hypothetical protein